MSVFVLQNLLKQVFNVVGHNILIVIKCCLATGSMPAHFKHAIVQPLLKRSNLDSTELSNFRPISKLPQNCLQSLRECSFYSVTTIF